MERLYDLEFRGELGLQVNLGVLVLRFKIMGLDEISWRLKQIEKTRGLSTEPQGHPH